MALLSFYVLVQTFVALSGKHLIGQALTSFSKTPTRIADILGFYGDSETVAHTSRAGKIT